MLMRDVKTMSKKEITWREKLALTAFEGRELLFSQDLPSGVGRATMRALVARRAVHAVAVETGKIREWAWRLVH
jgi:hypothetical protein